LIFPLHTFFLQTSRARKIPVSILKTEGRLMIWARMLAYITGSVDQEVLLRNEYLVAENRILRARIKGRLLLSDSEKTTLAEIAHRLGRKALAEVAATAKPDTLLG
jgi:putative transposase